MHKPTLFLFSLLSLACVSSNSISAEPQQEVNVYSARKEALIKPLLDKFTQSTGITVNLITGKGDALLTRLKSEGRNSPADLLITTDAGRLVRAKQAGVLLSQPVKSLERVVPQRYRDKDGAWYGLSLRARVLVYAKERVKPADLSGYEDLADNRWKGRICVRSSENIYNQSLVASMLANQGKDFTETWLKGFVANFARPPQGGDRDQIKAVAAGQCDVALVNSYYLGAMLQTKDEAQRQAAAKVALWWPNQQDRGTHVNISGAGITASTSNKANAIKLLIFLATKDSQQWYGEVNNEYPVRSDVAPSALLQSWGEFKADRLGVSTLGEHNTQAVMAMDRARWR